MSRRQAVRMVLDLPEVNIAIFAFLLSFPWEMLQSPFFRGLAEAPHWEAVQLCTAATLGDVGIMRTLFWIVSGFGGDATGCGVRRLGRSPSSRAWGWL